MTCQPCRSTSASSLRSHSSVGSGGPSLGVPYLAALAITVARLGIGKGYERFHASVKADLARQADLLRDVLGNPFRPVSGNPAWFTPTVHDLATGIYEEQAFDRIPLLANALEEAGCDNHDVLAHCRTPALHVRGCWVVDLLNAKT